MVASGRKRKSRIQNDSDICQRVQNSEIVVDKYGRLKFSCNWIPNSRAPPITMLVNPQKLKYNWNPYAKIMNHTSVPLSRAAAAPEDVLLNTASTPAPV